MPEMQSWLCAGCGVRLDASEEERSLCGYCEELFMSTKTAGWNNQKQGAEDDKKTAVESMAA